MKEFLESTDVIDWQTRQILELAKELSAGAADDRAVAKAVFEWVRDNIEHCIDFNRSEVTCRASDVLAARTGFCFAKSHLVAALMRANGIPAGFCYQRLSVDGDGPPYCLHGLNAVFLKEYGWYRIDARGNRDGVCAAFTPPDESLAFSIRDPREADLPEIWAAPLPLIVNALRLATSVEDLCRNLPDVAVLSGSQNLWNERNARAILNSYELHMTHLRRLVSDLDDEQMICQPSDMPNHPAWTIGHLVYSCQAIGGEFGIPAWLPKDWEQRFGTGSSPVADTAAYPDKATLLHALNDGKDRLAAALLSMGDAGLAEPLPDVRYRDRFPTIGDAAIHILSGHTALHLGQLTVWRQAMGLKVVKEPLNIDS